MKTKILCALVAVMFAVPLAGQTSKPKYGVTVETEKGVDYAAFKTYSWTKGQPSFDRDIDKMITEAVDRELSGLGMKKAADGAAGDVLAAYYSVSRTDVDVNAKADAAGMRPEQAVGTLMVALLDPKSRDRVIRIRIDKPIEAARAQLKPVIDEAVTEMFAKYPTRGK